MSEAFYVENTSTDFKPVPAGLHLALCYRIVDLGTQRSEYLGQEKFLRKVMLAWEIHSQEDDGTPLVTDDGKPMAIFKNYTLSWGDKANLRLDLQGWRGRPWSDEEARRFDLNGILGKFCMLNIIHRPSKDGSKTYSNVDSIAPVPSFLKQQGLPAGVNALGMFRIADPDMKLFDTFTDNLKKKIESSPEWKARSHKKATAAPASGFDDMDDDIPF
jgi:hypothetical protein